MNDLIIRRMRESIRVKEAILGDRELLEGIERVGNELTACLRRGGKLVLCGNGGSASDALHFAGEIVGRFQREREAWPALVLNADVATMTAVANDYGYDEVFARQVRGCVRRGDVFLGISASGNSANVVKAARCAREIGARTVGLLGKGGGALKEEVDEALIVPSDVTARIQESHIMIIHILCELVEEKMAREEAGRRMD